MAAAESAAAYRSPCTSADDLGFVAEKAHLAWVPTHTLQHVRYGDEAKYYGNWYGNRLAVTICVNTKTLLFSHSKSSASCKCR